MEGGAQKHKKEEFPPLPFQYVFHRIQSQRQRQIIPHRIKCGKIEAKRHKQEKAPPEAVALPIQRQQKQRQRKKGEHGKHKQEILSPCQPVQHRHQQVKTCFRRHVTVCITGNQMHEFHIFCIIVSYIQAARRYRKQNKKNGTKAQRIPRLSPADSPFRHCRSVTACPFRYRPHKCRQPHGSCGYQHI